MIKIITNNKSFTYVLVVEKYAKYSMFVFNKYMITPISFKISYPQKENIQQRNINISQPSRNYQQSFSGKSNIFKDFTNYFLSMTKLQFMLLNPINLLKFLDDTEAYAAAYFLEKGQIKVKSEIIGKLKLQKRNSLKTTYANILKTQYKNGMQRISLSKNNINLGYIDFKKKGNRVNIEYLTNIQSRKDYKNTEKLLVQALFEDCMNNGFIPEFKAITMEIGENKFSRAELYNRMGADIKKQVKVTRADGHKMQNAVEVTRQKSKNTIINLIENGKLLLENTKENFEKITK